MKLGLHFCIPDFWTILEEWPESLLTYWHTYYLLHPWDWENVAALGKSKYEVPNFEPEKKKLGRRRLSGGAY